jgi:hypothetical protein
MSNTASHKAFRVTLISLCLLVVVSVGCKLLSLTGTKMNMFEGTSAQQGAAKVKAKLGVDTVKVSRISIHEDEESIVVQDPTKPKNFDEYIWKDGVLSGPKPVAAMVLGNNELTADKMDLFNLDETNLGAVADVCRKVVERAHTEAGKCELISINWESANWTRPKADTERIRAKENEEYLKKARANKLTAQDTAHHTIGDLAVTWRVYVQGPRASKDFWVDLKGNVWDYQ